MAVDTDALTNQMIAAGKGLVTGVWSKIESFAIPELRKISVQVAALADPQSPWEPEEKKLLFKMQVRSAVAILVAMTALTMQMIQDAINAILGAVKDLINGAVGIALV